MKLIHVIPGGLAFTAVCRHAPPDLILHNQHTEFFQLLSQLLDVIADHAAVDIHIRAVVEHIQRARHIDFKRRCQRLRFLLRLLTKRVVQIFQNRHVFRLLVIQVRLIHNVDSTVNHRFLNGLQTVPPADNQLTQGQNEIRFQRQQVVIVAVIQVDFHRIDVIAAGRRNLNDLTAELRNKRCIFTFGVADDDIIVRDQHDIAHFALGGEGFA